MEFFLRLFQFIAKVFYIWLRPILQIFLPRQRDKYIPPISDGQIRVPLVQLTKDVWLRQIRSQDLVSSYIKRIKLVDPHLHAMVDEQFTNALVEAEVADALLDETPNQHKVALLTQYPLLGIPFTVKDAVGVKGMTQFVGNKKRMKNKVKATLSGGVVQRLCGAGAIILCTTTNSEFCFGIETNTMTNGRTLNPFDLRRTPGGSSGGEAALNGAAASLFGVGSDLAGSIRIPALFCGVFGHKPTAGATSVTNHFPYSTDPEFSNLMQVGPITRYATDLPVLMEMITTPREPKLDLKNPLKTSTIKVYYMYGFNGLNGFLHMRVRAEIRIAMMKAVSFFKRMEMQCAHIEYMNGLENSLEISLSAIARLKDLPYLINSNCWFKVIETFVEYVKSIFGNSEYTSEALLFELMRRTNGFMPSWRLKKYEKEGKKLKKLFIDMLGDTGVFIFPTFPVPALHHNTSSLAIWNIDYTLLFNVLGLPATHIPMGKNSGGLPVGFQVVAAPWMDKLCFQIAITCEQAFAGWVPPSILRFN